MAALDADFFAFSGHKVFGPTGIGALYGKRALLMHYLVTRLDELPGVRVVGNPVVRGSAGHHCAQPALARFGLTKTVRPSIALYNTHGDLDALAASLQGIGRLSLATEPRRGSARP